jgi:hypothetical protein
VDLLYLKERQICLQLSTYASELVPDDFYIPEFTNITEFNSCRQCVANLDKLTPRRTVDLDDQLQVNR